MIETEKAILAAVIEWPDNIILVIDNCDEGFFQSVESRELYRILKGLYEGRSIIDWATVFDLSRGRIRESYLASLLDTLKGVYASGVSSYIKEKIRLIKTVRTKKKLLAEVERQARLPDVDFEKIQQIINEAKITETLEEDKKFEAAYKEFLEWKNKEKTNITLGLPSFDRLIGSFSYGEIVSIFGRTYTAKTFLMLNIMEHLVGNLMDNEKVGFFSLEMAKPAIFERIAQIFFGKSRWDIQDELKEANINFQELLRRYERVNLYGKVYSVSEIEQLTKRDKLKIVFIDFLQLLKEEKAGSQYEKTTRKIRELKEFAKNQSVVIFLAVQISRKGEGGWEAVSISMARESGQIEELSDFIIGVWNPSLKEGASSKWKGKICMKLLKNKRGGPFPLVAKFDESSGRIIELEHELNEYFS